MPIVRINREEGTITPTGETLIKKTDFVYYIGVSNPRRAPPERRGR
jgi:hypothetical protein